MLLESQYFPSIPFCAIVAQNEKITIEAFEHYQKRSYRNRTDIVTAQGIQALSIPLNKGKNSQTPIQSVQINYDTDWQTQHLRSIKAAYGNAPFYIHYIDYIEQWIRKEETSLFKKNQYILKKLLKALKIKTTISFTNEYTTDQVEDYRNKFTPKSIKNTTPITYHQVFEDKIGFTPYASILDLVFNLGPSTYQYLKNIPIEQS